MRHIPVAHEVRPDTGSQSEYSASAWLGSRMMEMISPVGLYLCVGKEQRHTVYVSGFWAFAE